VVKLQNLLRSIRSKLLELRLQIIFKMNSKLKITFLDRDGVINRNAPPHEYITKAEDFSFNPEIFKVLNSLKDKGFKFIVLTNQRGIARGLMSESELAKIHSKMKTELSAQGIDILDIFYCPHSGESCDCRKPKPGLINQALAKYDIDLQESLMIGDSTSDAELCKHFNLKCFLVRQDHPEDFLEIKE